MKEFEIGVFCEYNKDLDDVIILMKSKFLEVE